MSLISKHKVNRNEWFPSFNNQNLTLRFIRAKIGLSAKHNHFLSAKFTHHIFQVFLRGPAIELLKHASASVIFPQLANL